MAEVAINPERVGAGLAYIESLTGTQNLPAPSPLPANTPIGKVRWARTEFFSFSEAVNLGVTGFGAAAGEINSSVLVKDYLVGTEVPVTQANQPIKSYIYGAGFRVALRVFQFDAQTDISFGVIAAKAQLQGKKVQFEIRIIGMPSGPQVPAALMSGDYNIESYRAISNFEAATIDWLEKNLDKLTPLPVAATISNRETQELIDSKVLASFRFSMHRILQGQSIAKALELMANRPDELVEDVIRAVYAKVLNRQELLRPGTQYEITTPNTEAKQQASKWINGYANVQ